MPTLSFTLIPVHRYTAPTTRAPAKPPKVTPKPTKIKSAKPAKPAKPARKKAAKKSRPRLSPQCQSIITDRIEFAIEKGLIRVCPEDIEYGGFLDLTLAELAELQRILVPEAYTPEPRAGRATHDTAPGSPDRIAVYAARHEAGRAITAPGDVGAVRRDGKQLKIAERKNGSGVRVVGWEG